MNRSRCRCWAGPTASTLPGLERGRIGPTSRRHGAQDLFNTPARPAARLESGASTVWPLMPVLKSLPEMGMPFVGESHMPGIGGEVCQHFSTDRLPLWGYAYSMLGACRRLSPPWPFETLHGPVNGAVLDVRLVLPHQQPPRGATVRPVGANGFAICWPVALVGPAFTLCARDTGDVPRSKTAVRLDRL